MTGSLNLYQGRRSPVNYLDQRSPQGRRSPGFLSHDRVRSPNGFPSSSPTIERRSPTDRRSPTFSIHTQDKRSPVTATPILEFTRKSPTSTVHVQDSRFYDVTPEDYPVMGSSVKRSSVGLFTPIPFTEKRSPVSSMPIPPITVSNPSETCKIVERMAESTIEIIAEQVEETKTKELEKEVTEKKEKISVMREILAFVRKPSKKVSTRTGRFAAAFSRAESGSGSGPLIRQSTFSCSPAAASTAAKSAVTKQMSEVEFEPKMSLKFSLNTKMSLRLRRSIALTDDKKKDKSKASGDDTIPSSGTEASKKQEQQQVGVARSLPPIPFELENVHFEKVGDSYIKHEQIKEEPSEEGSPIQIVALSNENAQISILTEEKMEEEEAEDSPDKQKDTESQSFRSPRVLDRCQEITSSSDNVLDASRLPIEETFRKSIEELRTEVEEYMKQIRPEPIYENLLELRRGEEQIIASSLVPLQCPTFEIEPPSRRSSFDPPRSPFLENLRSPGIDTDTELMNRLDSGGDSFEMVDIDRNRESSFEDRYSSRDTSFDISRYQSTSYEDQTSSFEIVDIDIRAEEKKSDIDLRKSSIELVDPETFQKSGASSGRKSSLETHFDYNPSETLAASTEKAMFPLRGSRKAKTRSRDIHISPFTAFSRARSPLSNQTSSNYSSRDSYDSNSSYQHIHVEQKSPFADPSRQHFPLTIKGQEEVRTFLCTDQRCASIFEPRPSTGTTSFLCSQHQPLSGNEFEPPSPRRAASASPKHTFTFRIVLKKVDSSPDAICPSNERRSRDRDDRFKRRDSRRKRLADAGKSF